MNIKPIRFDFNSMLDTAVGDKGITACEIDAIKQSAHAAFDEVLNSRGTGMLEWTELPYQNVDGILACAGRIREKFDNFVVLGIGGSALGPIAVQQALSHFRYNELPKEKRGGPRLYVEDNVDPERMNSLFDIIDIEKTCFNVITKSGATSETMAQYLIIQDMLSKKLKNHTSNIITTTSASKGNLIKIAKAEGYENFIIPEGVGGRFSELSPVGLLAAAVCGIDIREMLAGAADMDKRCGGADANPALFSAALMVIAMRKGFNVSVMMPYADSLKTIADWYSQLWAESLGKRYKKKCGCEVFVGQTPVKALGVTDQHSQVQLYTEGPFDKVTTFIGVENFRSSCTIPAGCDDFPDVNFLCGKTLEELIHAEQEATEYALLKAGRMNMTITLPEVRPHTIGQLLYFFELQTAYAGAMLGIDAFDQPGVETGKIATFALMGRKGYEDKKAELMARPGKDSKYIM